MARARKQLDFRVLAEALTDPALDAVPMEAIAARLGIAKPTLYRMAGSRAELVRIAVDAEGERLLEQVHHHGLRGLFRFADESPAGFLLLFGGRYPETRQAVRRVENRLRDAHVGDAQLAAGLLALAAGMARRAIEDGVPIASERLRSDFDEVAKIASRISDDRSVQTPSAAA